jgi:anti-sigma28 factor (negative regulator of flagellin synthesis)
MNISSSYRVNGPQSLQGPHFSRPAAPASSPQATRGADQVDISAAGEAAALASETSAVDTSGFRADLVARIRNEIAQGTYETADKLNSAVDRLLDEIG